MHFREALNLVRNMAYAYTDAGHGLWDIETKRGVTVLDTQTEAIDTIDAALIKARIPSRLDKTDDQIVVALTRYQSEYLRNLLYMMARGEGDEKQRDFIDTLADQFEQCEMED